MTRAWRRRKKKTTSWKAYTFTWNPYTGPLAINNTLNLPLEMFVIFIHLRYTKICITRIYQNLYIRSALKSFTLTSSYKTSNTWHSEPQHYTLTCVPNLYKQGALLSGVVLIRPLRQLPSLHRLFLIHGKGYTVIWPSVRNTPPSCTVLLIHWHTFHICTKFLVFTLNVFAVTCNKGLKK